MVKAKKKRAHAERERHILSFAEVSRLTGKTRSAISHAVARGLLVLSKSGRGINPHDPHNAPYFRKNSSIRIAMPTSGRTSALLQALASKYNLRRQRIKKRLAGLVPREMVELWNEVFVNTLSISARGIPAMLTLETARALKPWLEEQIGKAIVHAKGAAEKAVRRSARDESGSSRGDALRDLGGTETWDELRILLSLCDSYHDDLIAAQLAGDLITLEEAKKSAMDIAAEISASWLILPARIAYTLPPRPGKAEVSRIRARLTAEIEQAIERLRKVVPAKESRAPRRKGNTHERRTRKDTSVDGEDLPRESDASA